MDVRCVKCGEPWEIDYFHDVAAEQGSTFAAVRRGFFATGCEALGCSHGDMSDPNVEVYAALYDLLGDDEYAAAMIEDFDAMGGF